MLEKITFESFGLHQGLLKALEEAEFKIPSEIQQEVIPHILAGRDLIGQAQTGTGKTGAFGLPALHLLQDNPEAQMLVMTPTRELAKQVSDELYRFSRHLDIRTATICGGKSFKGQMESLQNGIRVLVATPGRLLDLLSSQKLPNFQPSIVVLDEADEMLNMGFLEDIRAIFKYIPKERQTLLFSATMPMPIQKLAEQILHKPLFISAKQKEKVNQDIEQFYYMIREDEREHALIRLIDYENPEKAIIFCRTKKDVDWLTQYLLDVGYAARGLHGDMEQPQREEVIRNFRSSHLHLLVATDVAARGLSVSNVSHVFNYHLPFDPTQYVHRIGRTGRAGNKGIASTILTSRDWRDFQRFEKALGTKIRQKEIPTLKDVKAAKQRHLVKQIVTQQIHPETAELLNLMSEMNEKEIAAKMISMLLGQQTIGGPDRIGLEGKPNNEPTRHRTTSPARKGGGKRFSSKPPFKNFKSSNSSKQPKKPFQKKSRDSIR
jgi:ATP-dependent RNA helicase DeaD